MASRSQTKSNSRRKYDALQTGRLINSHSLSPASSTGQPIDGAQVVPGDQATLTDGSYSSSSRGERTARSKRATAVMGKSEASHSRSSVVSTSKNTDGRSERDLKLVQQCVYIKSNNSIQPRHIDMSFILSHTIGVFNTTHTREEADVLVKNIRSAFKHGFTGDEQCLQTFIHGVFNKLEVNKNKYTSISVLQVMPNNTLSIYNEGAFKLLINKFKTGQMLFVSKDEVDLNENSNQLISTMFLENNMHLDDGDLLVFGSIGFWNNIDVIDVIDLINTHKKQWVRKFKNTNPPKLGHKCVTVKAKTYVDNINGVPDLSDSRNIKELGIEICEKAENCSTDKCGKSHDITVIVSMVSCYGIHFRESMQLKCGNQSNASVYSNDSYKKTAKTS